MATKFRFNYNNQIADFEDFYVRTDILIPLEGNVWAAGYNGFGNLVGDNTIVNISSPVQIIGDSNVWTSISTQVFNSVGIKKDGTLWTWGRNFDWMLGDNTLIHKSSPVQTIAGGNTWSQAACGSNHVLAAKTDGTLWLWGNNSYGQLGDNTTTHRSSPAQIIGFSNNWSKVSASSHSAAIKTDGTLWMWGLNNAGQIGDGAILIAVSPTQVVGAATTWSSISTGNQNSAGIKTDGTLWTWGRTNQGTLGNNSTTHRNSPTQTTALGTNWSSVSCGIRHMVAIKKDGTLWTWGSNSQGSLGNNSSFGVESPIQTISYGTNWSKVSCGLDFSAAIKTDGTLWTWGNNGSGQLGNNTVSNISSPTQTITLGTNWSQVSCGASHMGSVKPDGTLWLWGSNSGGQLGVSGQLNQSSPIQNFIIGNTWSSIAGGLNFTIATKTDGTLWCWGSNSIGQLGNNTTINYNSPIQTITYGTNWSFVSVEYLTSAGIKSDGTLWMWGRNSYGSLGDNSTISRSSPVQTASGGSTWSKVDCGSSHTGAIKTDGTLWMWGSNNVAGFIPTGCLGDNTTINKSVPTQTITGGTNWAKINVSTHTTAAIKTDGTLWMWGRNSYGQLGDNTIVNKSSPIQTITFATNWTEVSLGYGMAAAIKTDGTLWTWGRNTFGQLGDNTNISKSSPIQTISYGTNWSKIACGYYHVAAIKKDGTLWTWGYNNSGQLGNLTTTNSSSPVQTVSYGNNWNNVACGQGFTLATKTDGTLWLWGQNSDSQISFTGINLSSSPIQTITLGTNWSSVSCGNANTVAIKKDGTLWIWGAGTFGALGANSVSSNFSPAQTIAYGTNWSDAINGSYTTIARKTDGSIWVWGRNNKGQLALGNLQDISSPVQTISLGTNWSSVATALNGATSGATKTDGTLWMWGDNAYLSLGDGKTNLRRSSPVQTIFSGTNWSEVSCGTRHTAAIKTDGTLWIWGRNDEGQLANNLNITTEGSPQQTISGGANWRQVSCGVDTTAAIKTDGTLWVWGRNSYGQLGDNTIIHRSSPVQTISGGGTWKQVSCGTSVKGLKKDGTLWAWGINNYGQLADNTTTNKSSPVQTVAGGTTWIKLGYGYNLTAFKAVII